MSGFSRGLQGQQRAVALRAGSVAASLVGSPEVCSKYQASIRLAALLVFGFTGFGVWLRNFQRGFSKVFNHFKAKVV